MLLKPAFPPVNTENAAVDVITEIVITVIIGQVNQAAQILVRPERVAETHFDILLLPFHGAGVQNVKRFGRRHRHGLRSGLFRVNRRAVPCQRDFRIRLFANDAGHEKEMLAAEIVRPLDSQILPVLRGA